MSKYVNSKKLNLRTEIELLRLKLQMLLDIKEIDDPEVLKASKELRLLLDQYYTTQQAVKS